MRQRPTGSLDLCHGHAWVGEFLKSLKSLLVLLLGRHLRLEQDEIVALRRGGYLHDLGKIAVPDDILKKGSDLTPEEWLVMKLHPITGENICKPLHSLRLVLPIIRHHHEHTDGSGYPDGLVGSDIPILPRILKGVLWPTSLALRASMVFLSVV